MSAVSGHLLYYVPQSLVISCTMSAVSGHPLYCVRSLWSSPVLCPQPLVISCTMSTVSGHLLYRRVLWSKKYGTYNM
ncbi:unnamed protein product [Staurois parvus]|uniref:Uncharacterized protein n=1 Tax=Staurois parvus TaxID=386267 RepID=A0ABN9C4W6_9NEOB|nr:unnamed protein product [Staurois parvus]